MMRRRVGVRPAINRVGAVTKRVEEGVVAGFTTQCIALGAAGDGVVAGAAEDDIAAGAAVETVILAEAIDDVAAAATKDEVLPLVASEGWPAALAAMKSPVTMVGAEVTVSSVPWSSV